MMVEREGVVVVYSSVLHCFHVFGWKFETIGKGFEGGRVNSSLVGS